MKPEFSKFVFWTAVAAGTVCVLVLATLTFQSIFRLFGAQPEREKAIPAAAEIARPEPEVKPVPDAGDPSSVNPADNEFCTDSQLIRQQEREQQENIDDRPPLNIVPPSKQIQQGKKHNVPLI